MVLYLLWLPTAAAVCQIDVNAPSVDAAYSRIDDFEAASTEPYPVNGIATSLDIMQNVWRAGHEYLALDYDRENLTTPVTNGDLHSLYWAYRKTGSDGGDQHLYWELVPTLAVSSNQLKNPGQIKTSSFRLDGHLLWQTTQALGKRYTVGICLSSLAGSYGAIPLLAVTYYYSNMYLVLGYPHTELNYKLTDRLELVAGWSLSGRQWEVLDSELTQRNDVELGSRQYRLGLSINLTPRNIINIYWMKHYDQSLEYLARDDVRVNIDMENTQIISMGYNHNF